MLTAYIDDSGTSRENKVATAGGYISSVHLWGRFKGPWQTLLDSYDVKQMHRADLESFKKEFCANRGWNPKRRDEFVKKAQRIIRRHTQIAVGSAVIKSDFEKTIPEPIRKYYGGPYGWCAHECLSQASNWCDRVKHKEPIQWVFEKGTVGTGQIERYLDRCSRDPRVSEMLRLEVGGWSFQGKEILPLQAADVIAYEIYKQVQNQIVDKGKRDVRLSALDLFREKDRPYIKLRLSPPLEAGYL